MRLSQVAVKTKPDGIIGPTTIEAINEMDLESWDLRFCLARIIRYRDIVQKDKSQRKWFLGWVNRAIGGLSLMGILGTIFGGGVDSIAKTVGRYHR